MEKLRRYIIKAVLEINQKAAIALAGGTHFKKANKGIRAEITELFTAGQTYLKTNAVILADKAKMPASFPADYNKAKEAFDKEYLGYGSAKGNATNGTVDKVKANNMLYNKTQLMFGDAQVALDGQKSVTRQFSFAAVKRLVTKDMAGIHFTILNTANKPIIDAIITTDESGESYPVNKRAVANILMKVGVHSITVSCPGYQIYTGVVKTDAGIKHRVTISLKKEAVHTEVAEVAFNEKTQLEQ